MTRPRDHPKSAQRAQRSFHFYKVFKDCTYFLIGAKINIEESKRIEKNSHLPGIGSESVVFINVESECTNFSTQ